MIIIEFLDASPSVINRKYRIWAERFFKPIIFISIYNWWRNEKKKKRKTFGRERKKWFRSRFVPGHEDGPWIFEHIVLICWYDLYMETCLYKTSIYHYYNNNNNW